MNVCSGMSKIDHMRPFVLLGDCEFLETTEYCLSDSSGIDRLSVNSYSDHSGSADDNGIGRFFIFK